MPEIKICGLSREADIEAANTLMPDYIGFVFAKSRRLVTADRAAELKARLLPPIRAVGVFVDEDIKSVAQTAAGCGLFAAQLHGGEDDEYIAALRKLLPAGCEVWKAARVANAGDITAAAATGADRLVLDAFCPGLNGGTGTCFNWAVMRECPPDRPFFIAGGINAANVTSALKAAEEFNMPFGIDVSGGVETDGVKDFCKMKELITLVRTSVDI